MANIIQFPQRAVSEPTAADLIVRRLRGFKLMDFPILQAVLVLNTQLDHEPLEEVQHATARAAYKARWATRGVVLTNAAIDAWEENTLKERGDYNRKHYPDFIAK